MLESQTAPVATDYLGMTATLRNSKHFDTVVSGIVSAVSISLVGLESLTIDAAGTMRVSDGSDYQSKSEYYWNIESVVNLGAL